MKNVIFILAGIMVSGIVLLLIKGSDPRVISTEIEISATPGEVWQVLADINKWHEWSPIISESRGTAALDEHLEIGIVGSEHEPEGPKYNPKIIHFEAPVYFHWRAHMIAGILMTNDKVFELEETATGTKVIHREIFSGLLVPILYGQMERGVPPMLDSMNQALKQLVEASKKKERVSNSYH